LQKKLRAGQADFFPVPRLALKLHFGEGATVLTRGQHVIPQRLMQEGFTFKFSAIDEAVKDCVSS